MSLTRLKLQPCPLLVCDRSSEPQHFGPQQRNHGHYARPLDVSHHQDSRAAAQTSTRHRRRSIPGQRRGGRGGQSGMTWPTTGKRPTTPSARRLWEETDTTPDLPGTAPGRQSIRPSKLCWLLLRGDTAEATDWSSYCRVCVISSLVLSLALISSYCKPATESRAKPDHMKVDLQ